MQDNRLAALDLRRLGLSEAQALARIASTNLLDLFAEETEADTANRALYDAPASLEHYRNFLAWLFATFGEQEASVRRSMLAPLALQPGDKVLITGCGFGEDVALAAEQVGPTGQVHAQDLSRQMAAHTAAQGGDTLLVTTGSALALPYRDGAFDACFHMGGINLFGDMTAAIAEMHRVTRIGGRVAFGDESIAPHLRAHEQGRIALTNNPLWGAPLPLDHLPPEALHLRIDYLLGNCFYLISYQRGAAPPAMDIDVPHQGWRGGTMRSRHYGQLDGVAPDLKTRIERIAKARGTSVHALLNGFIAGLEE